MRKILFSLLFIFSSAFSYDSFPESCGLLVFDYVAEEDSNWQYCTNTTSCNPPTEYNECNEVRLWTFSHKEYVQDGSDGQTVYNWFYHYTKTYYKPAPDGVCPDGLIADSNGICLEPECSPLSDTSISLDSSQCVEGASYSDDTILSGTLTFQECDNTCYVLEAIKKTCDDAYKNFISSCDTDLNTPLFDCTAVSASDDSISSLNTDCTPKNESPIQSPCDYRYETVKTECLAQDKDIIGVCHDNGITITEDTLECVDKVPQCDTKWHEHLDSSSNTCICDSGFIRTSLGDCRLPFSWEEDENLTQEQEDKITEADNQLNNSKNSSSSDSNVSSSSSDNIDLTTTNNTLAGIRSDLNTTNNLLNKMADKLDSNDSDNMSYSSPNMDTQSKIMDAFDTVSTSMDNISNDYNNLLSMVEQGFSASPVSSGVTPSFSAVVFGHTITLDMCESFSMFYPIGYFVFSIIFIIIGVRIFLYAFMMGV